MKKSRYSEAQIVSILKEAENGVPVPELCRTQWPQWPDALIALYDPCNNAPLQYFCDAIDQRWCSTEVSSDFAQRFDNFPLFLLIKAESAVLSLRVASDRSTFASQAILRAKASWASLGPFLSSRGPRNLEQTFRSVVASLGRRIPIRLALARAA